MKAILNWYYCWATINVQQVEAWFAYHCVSGQPGILEISSTLNELVEKLLHTQTESEIIVHLHE